MGDVQRGGAEMQLGMPSSGAAHVFGKGDMVFVSSSGSENSSGSFDMHGAAGRPHAAALPYTPRWGLKSEELTPARADDFLDLGRTQSFGFDSEDSLNTEFRLFDSEVSAASLP